jgi:hypothetical protein
MPYWVESGFVVDGFTTALNNCGAQANPRLLDALCNKIEQMRLVNTLCFAKAYADGETEANIQN